MYLLAIIGLAVITWGVDSLRVELCDGQNEIIRCKLGEKIKVLVAQYGRTDSKTCAKSDVNDYKRCGQVVPRSAITERCDGKRYCPLSVSLTALGLKRSCGANSYLSLSYICIPPPTTAPPKTVLLCDGHSHKIFCGRDEIINITSVYWGREDLDTCYDFYAWFDTTHCQSHYAKKTIEDLCNGRQSCGLIPSKRYLGNPCWGISEYLKVSYKCNKKPVPTTPVPKVHQRIVCAKRNSIINCPGRMRLDIVKATYGGQDESVCPQKESKGKSNCSVDVTKFFQKDCQKKSYCLVAADRFAKECPGGSHNVDVSYKCL